MSSNSIKLFDGVTWTVPSAKEISDFISNEFQTSETQKFAFMTQRVPLCSLTLIQGEKSGIV